MEKPLLLIFIGFLFFTSLKSQQVSTIASINGNPSGIAVDNSGNVYIAQRSPATEIIKFNPNTNAYTNHTTGIQDALKIIFGSDGNLYVSDFVANKIIKVLNNGTKFDYVTGASQPCGMVFDADTLYFIEYASQRIYKVLPGGGAVGSSNVLAITPSGWINSQARGTGLELLPNGNLIVTCALHYNIYEVNKSTGAFDTLLDNGIYDHTIFDITYRSKDGKFYMPGLYSQRILSLDTANFNQNTFTGNGTDTTINGMVGDTLVAFSGPYFIAKDANEDLYISESNSKKIRKINFSTTGIYDFDEDKSIRMFPNPATNYLQLNFSEPTSFSIYNITGKKINDFSLKASHLIDVSDYTNGIYILKTDNGQTQKFIKQ